jgi:hypothetical protein
MENRLLHLKKQGNFPSFIILGEMIVVMDIQKEAVFVTKTSLGDDISADNSDLTRKIEAARQGMKKYRNALVQLAK